MISIKSYIHLKTWLPNSLLPNTPVSLTIYSILLHIPVLGLTSVICITTVTQVSLYYITQAVNLALWRMKPRFWRLLIAASNLCIKAFVQKYLKWCLMNPVISATCRHHSQPTAAAPTLVQWGYISQGSSSLLRIRVTSTCAQVPQQSSDKNHCIHYLKTLQSSSQPHLSSSTAPWLLNTTLIHLMISLCCLKLGTVFTICCWSLADRLSDRIITAHPLYVTLQSPTTYQIAKVINSFLLCRHWLVFWSVFALAPTWSPWR